MIKTLHILILLIFFQNLIYCQNQNDMLTVEKASKLIRKNVIVKGKVITVFYAKSSSGKPTFLNIDKDFPNNPLVVVIFEKNLKKLNLVSVSMLLVSPNLFAWGATGHRTVAEIAEKHLSKVAKEQINLILDNQSLAFVSTYADEIRSDKNFDQYTTWHYVDFPFDSTYENAEKNPKGDLVTGINKCIAVLKDKSASKSDKAFYLKLLIHFIGDLHQPLHIGLASDKGGNTIEVSWFNRKTNLHSVWDNKMIDDYKMSYSELANNTEYLSPIQIQNIQKGNIIDWVNDTRALTKKVYDSAQAGENLSYKYMYDNFGIVRSQLQKGGLRLAKLLNDIFQ